jgi:hypothetical protein
VPEDGTTEVLFEDHLPAPLRISRVAVTIDGELVYSKIGEIAPRTPIFRARIPEGDHAVDVLVQIESPCGVIADRHDTLVIKETRPFAVGPRGGLVHVDAFARSPWLELDRRLALAFAFRGVTTGEAHFVYAWSDEAKELCGEKSRTDAARCVVERLLDRSRERRDVVSAICHREKLDAIDAAIAGGGGDGVEARVEALAREADRCLGADPGWIGAQQVTWDARQCARYDDPRSSLTSGP